jgi:Cof subfamily protein (haloacid dehalogenase superfamily)
MRPYQNIILITDLDGTLADSRHKVSEENKKAIAYFVAQGGHFGVATGRTPKNAVPYMEGLAINTPCILYNGGALYSWEKQHFIKTRHLESGFLAEYLRRLMQLFPQMCIEVFTKEQLYVITDSANVDEHMKREQQEFSYAELADILDEAWLKIILCDSHEHLLASRELLTEFRLAEKTNNFFSAEIYLEIVAKHVSKGNMLGELLNLEAYRSKKVIAAGDFQNDIEMLRRADCGVAPANAQADVKAAADIIAASNDEHLIHDIIYRILPTLR